MGLTLHTPTLDDTVSDLLGADLALTQFRVCPEATVGALLSRLPTGHQLVSRGVGGAARAADAYVTAEALSESADSLPEGIPERSYRWEQSLRARAESALLVDGEFGRSDSGDGRFVTSSGELLTVYRSVMRPPEGQHVWAVLVASPSADWPDGLLLTLSYVSPYRGPIFLPDYGHSLADNFVRCRVIERLLPSLGWAGASEAEREQLTNLLWDLHCPQNEQQAWQVSEFGTRGIAAEWLERVIGEDYQHHQRESAAGLLPPPRLIKTHREAEEYAAEVLWALGFTDAEPTPLGADGGVDVVGSGVVAQVKMEGIPTGRPVLQAIAGIAAVEETRAVVFSLSGYTPQALEWAARAGVACFEFAFDGSVEARSSSAFALLSEVGSTQPS